MASLCSDRNYRKTEGTDSKHVTWLLFCFWHRAGEIKRAKRKLIPKLMGLDCLSVFFPVQHSQRVSGRESEAEF